KNACVFISLHGISQNLLKQNWKFNQGDDPAFANEGFDDSNWKEIDGTKLWESQGYDTYDGFAWYRQEVFIPKKLKKLAKKEGSLILYLGMIDDVDETFWNGEKIGGFGKLPPNYETAYAAQRKFEIPLNKVNFGAKNLIAVRVYDHGGGGGLYGDEFYLGAPGMKDLIKMNWEGLEKDQILSRSKPLRFRISNNSSNSMKGNANVLIKNDFGKTIQELSKEISVKKKDIAIFEIKPKQLEPGFYEASIQFNAKQGGANQKMAFGVAPEEIVSETDRREDFEDYWRRAKKELAAVEPQFKMTKLEEYSTENIDAYLIEMRSLGNVLVRGFYSKPKAAGTYPALLRVQGYGTTKTAKDLIDNNQLVTFVLNIRGHGNSKQNINPGFPGYMQHHINDKEYYIYRGAYMDCIRAVDFLFEQSEVDKNRVAVEGGSQGGALSFATAALDNERIMACAPDVPFLS
ncbi:MAG: acetylxylan esterase, partial [Bacteroidota bacterium]